MAYKEMTFTHRRPSRTGDGAGGKTTTYVTQGVVTGRKHFYQRRSQQEMEKTEAPARAVVNEQVVIFDDTTLDIQQQDVLLEGDVADADADEAVTWRVKHVRPYDFTFQVDVELVA